MQGLISANGSNQTYRGGSGGSVFITAGTMSGTTSGAMRANGGICGSAGYGAGGGGRISLVVTNPGASFSGLACAITAYGGNASHSGAAGTIYLETPSQGTGQGTLIIDNNNGARASGVYTLMPPGVNLNNFSQIVLTNKAELAIGTGNIFYADSSKFSTVATNPSLVHVTIINTNGVSFPANYTIAGYSLGVDVPLSATGNWTIDTNGVLVHSYNGDAETNKLNLAINGNLTINAGGLVALDALGFSPGKGLGGAPANSYNAGSYGGLGAYDTAHAGPLIHSYGSITAPVNIGSGGDGGQGLGAQIGGGALLLAVTGTLTNNGTITANGGFDYYSGSGGSIFISAGALYGATSGVIQANGGNAYSAGGGGGRVAVILTNAGADFNTYGGTITAYGGTPGATAGTVYRQTAAQTAGMGMVIVNNGATTTNATFTSLPAFSNSTENISRTVWVTTNKARLCLLTNAAIASLTLNANGYLELNGYTLTVKALTVTNKVYKSGAYGPHDTPISVLTDADSGGKVLIKPSSTVVYFR